MWTTMGVATPSAVEEQSGLARVLCLALVQPAFQQALLADPEQALRQAPALRALLSPADLRLVLEAGATSLEALAALIEQRRPTTQSLPPRASLGGAPIPGRCPPMFAARCLLLPFL